MKAFAYTFVCFMVLINLIVLYFYLGGAYNATGTKTISDTDIRNLMVFDLLMAAALIFTIKLTSRYKR